MVLLDGWLGAQPEFRARRLYIEAANANIAGMQQQLWFPVDDPDDFEPELTVVYTPNLVAHGWPDDRLILVDLENGVNRVFNSDYFGESKEDPSDVEQARLRAAASAPRRTRSSRRTEASAWR